ncbi:hypothetical protein [Streptomonospora salina]|uniref:Abortive infection protein-like C-terminal domain-containing protein n=1 Tax=Streptomonospora salina TaxID=104205 RepID=A0A841EAY5_9ACTN|nr:hypothetical protein [Streptomonospora salina]MBB6000146.1 hypothetical protein [Streptomonospora salina]
MTEYQRLHLLRDRLAGRPTDDTVHPGTPEWLLPCLKEWMTAHVGQREAREVTLEFRLAPHTVRGRYDYLSPLLSLRDLDLLTAIDAAIQLDRRWNAPPGTPANESLIESCVELGRILLRGGSYLRFDPENRCLMRRVDETAQLAYDQACENASDAASKHLRKAWHSAYRTNPDPDGAYAEAVLAVEAVLNPLVHPTAEKPTLSKSYKALQQQAASGKWTLNFGDPERPAKESIDKLIGMCQLLMEHHDSRHAGGMLARQQTQDEAEAAVHLAVLLVQWLSTGVLKRG